MTNIAEYLTRRFNGLFPKLFCEFRIKFCECISVDKRCSYNKPNSIRTETS